MGMLVQEEGEGRRSTPMAILHLKASQSKSCHHRKERNMREGIARGISHSVSAHSLWKTGIEVSPAHAAEQDADKNE